MPKTSGMSHLGKKCCPICKGRFRSQAFRGHVNKCEREKKIAEGLEEYEREVTEKMVSQLASWKKPDDEAASPHDGPHTPDSPELGTSLGIADSRPDTPPQADAAERVAISKFRVKYHPRSRKYVKVHYFEEYLSAYRPPPHPPRRSDPWWPFFNTREDFLLAKLVLETGMNREQADRLLKLFDHCITGKGTCTFASYADVEAAWERASTKVTPVSEANKDPRSQIGG